MIALFGMCGKNGTKQSRKALGAAWKRFGYRPNGPERGPDIWDMAFRGRLDFVPVPVPK